MDLDDFYEAIEGLSGMCPESGEAQAEMLEEALEEIDFELPDPVEDWEDAEPHTLVIYVGDFDSRIELLVLPKSEVDDDLAMIDCVQASVSDFARESPEGLPAALRVQAKMGYLTADAERMQGFLDGITGICDAAGTAATLPSATELVEMCGRWNPHSIGSYDADDEGWFYDECNPALLARRISNVVVFRIIDDWG